MARRIADYRFYEAVLRQPEELGRLLSAPEPVDLAAETLSGARRVFAIGIGTSGNAAAAAALMFGAAGLDALAWSSHDFSAYAPDAGPADAAMLFTHTGAKQFSLRSLELLAQRNIPAVVVTSTETAIGFGTLPSNSTILRTTALERSEVATVSYTAALLLAARVASDLRPGAIGDLGAVPGAVEQALHLERELFDLADAWHGPGRAPTTLGAGPHEVSAREAALKVAEAARRPAHAYAVEQFLHGHHVAVRDGDPFLIFAADGPAQGRTRQAAEFAGSVGGDVAWVAPVQRPGGARWIRVPDVGEWLAPIVQAVPAQLLAGHLAARGGVDADVLRMDDPRFAAAHRRLEP